MNLPVLGPPPYPLIDFPRIVQSAALEVCKYVQAPDALTGMAFLTAISVSCQGLIDVALPTGQVRPVSINLLAIADSGERKSALDSLVAAPLYVHDEARAAHYETAVAEYAAELTFWKTVNSVICGEIKELTKLGKPTEHLRIKLIEHAKKAPPKPRLRRIMRQNLSERSMMDVIEGDGESIALMTDEGEVVFKGGAMNHLGMRNKAWDGARMLAFDRVVAGSIIARNPRCTVAIMTQQTVFEDYVERHGKVARGSGHWARYLIAKPASTQGMRLMSHADPVWIDLQAFHERIKELLDEYDRMINAGKVERKLIEFSDEAKACWIEMMNRTEGMIGPWGYLRDISDFASKAIEIAGRIAALMHHFTKQEGKITLDTFLHALNIMEWHLHEFKRIFSQQFELSQMQADMNVLVRYLHSHYWMNGFAFAARNEVLRNGPFQEKKRFDPVLDGLCVQRCTWIGVLRNSKKRLINLDPQFFSSLALR
jgi:hypothetical protein